MAAVTLSNVVKRFGVYEIIHGANIDIADGATVTAGPGDVLVTAKGCRGTWRARSFVEKFWAVYHG